MKIYGQSPRKKDEAGLSVFVHLDGNSVTITKGPATITLTKPEPVEIVGIYEGISPTLLYALTDSERFASRDSVSMAMETQGLSGVANFVGLLAATTSGVYFITREHLDASVKPASYLEPDSQGVTTPREYLRTLDSELDAFVKKIKAKRQLLSGLTPTDSLSALEKQVDLLTMLVLSLARKQPTAEQPAWLDELETVFNNTSSVQEDALEKAVTSMGEYKARIRALQEEYFKNRSINKGK